MLLNHPGACARDARQNIVFHANWINISGHLSIIQRVLFFAKSNDASPSTAVTADQFFCWR